MRQTTRLQMGPYAPSYLLTGEVILASLPFLRWALCAELLTNGWAFKRQATGCRMLQNAPNYCLSDGVICKKLLSIEWGYMRQGTGERTGLCVPSYLLLDGAIRAKLLAHGWGHMRQATG